MNYLAAILNSNVINKIIKPYQSRGKFGPRDICRLPFEQNVPQFDPDDKLHAQIASLGIAASKEARRLPRTSRTKTKAAISVMGEIDRLILMLLDKKKI